MSATTAPNIDAQGIQWDARWIGWGKGKYHVQLPGESETVCGKTIPDDGLRGKIYSGWECSRCTAHEEESAAAETYRKALFDFAHARRSEGLEANRAGTFSVLRCKLCGAQHTRPGDGCGAVAFCMDEGHPADLEEVKAIGPRWYPPASSPLTKEDRRG